MREPNTTQTDTTLRHPAANGASLWRRRVGLAWKILRIPLVAYLVLVLLAMWFEESLIFVPYRFPLGEWEPVHLAVEDAEFTAADGTKLHGWYVPHANPVANILYLHGNGGNITHRLTMLEELHRTTGAAVFILDYRGYGKSAGSPTEKGVLQDARAARKWLAEKAGVGEEQIVLLGESLGGGVAVDLAAELPPKALILESTFTSLPDVAAIHYPILPVKLLMSSRLDSLTKIAGYRGPLMASHGKLDEIIPFRLGKQLFDAAPGARKLFIELDGYHNDARPSDYYFQLREFLQQ